MLKALSIFWNHKVGVVFFLFLVTLIGIFSALKIEKTMYPNTSLPQYSITASWGNYSPEVIELKLTAPIERAVAKLKYVKGIQSTSRRGTSQVTVFCDKNYHDKEFELLINEQLRDLRDNFSRNVNMRMSRSKPDEQGNRTSFLSYRIFSSYSIDSLSRIVENDIQSALSSIQGVSEVNVNGLEKQAYFITIKREFRNMRQFSQRVVQQRISDYFQLKKNAIVEMDNNEFIIKFRSEQHLCYCRSCEYFSELQYILILLLYISR
ncbi:MAG: efflux RND transporter permease subunit, partial [Calditrichaeota bacterium]|nr:efflux RND transporter permease subunit [Calditrichota bacterium]